MRMRKRFCLMVCMFMAIIETTMAQEIPLPEHPRPDLQRREWKNLNGMWDFTFDETKVKDAIASREGFADRKIMVPFSWTCKLSGIQDTAHYKGWYHRRIEIPRQWKGKRLFLVIGAAEYETEAWLDGKYLGKHKGGYTPFEMELTDLAKAGCEHSLILGCDDSESRTQFGLESRMHLFGKQEYGNVSGIWQTTYLEARGTDFIRYAHFTPDVDQSSVRVDVELGAEARKTLTAIVEFPNGDCREASMAVTGKHATMDIPIDAQHLWTLNDPYLYEAKVSLMNGKGQRVDEIKTYFGQRKIGVTNMPGTGYPYISLNNKPLYMQLTLDQSYHPEGFYTFPTDEFMKNEILLSKRLGLTGNRIHIKTEIPRKLYWADKLGLLIMADIPCFWGPPVEEAKNDWIRCMREQVERDYNHPSVFAWINFNETWGLMDVYGKKKTYSKETQRWVVEMYRLTKSLDSSRLVEDNSATNGDHTETDLNTWHKYKPSYLWEETITGFEKGTYPGSTLNFAEGYKQGSQPMLNSECGNVWGYKGSAGDSDFSWDYHVMVNKFRCHPKCAGFLYTEHHDVLNEWNGYVRYDRSPKYDGMSDLMPSMTLTDLHSPYFICTDTALNIICRGGEEVRLPLHASYMTDEDPGQLTMRCQLVGWNQIGERGVYCYQERAIPFKPWGQLNLDPIVLTMPEQKGVYVLQMMLTNQHGEVRHRNFTTFTIKEGKDIVLPETCMVTFSPSAYKTQQWSLLHKSVMEGKKENGYGHGYFEYEVELPSDVKTKDIESITLLAEISAKRLFGKDLTDDIRGLTEMEFIAGRGTKDPTRPSCAYSMTDNKLHSSKVVVTVNGINAGEYDLEDDPADHRGILSWGAQAKDGRLQEAGSYGYLKHVAVPLSALTSSKLTIRLSVPKDYNKGEGGLAIYGREFGRYPLDPTLIIKMKHGQ